MTLSERKDMIDRRWYPRKPLAHNTIRRIKMDSKTEVMFRWWENSVVAIFPEDPTDRSGDHCSSYQHVGQHGSCNPSGIVQRSRPATPEEYASLKTELETIGYTLKVIARQTRHHRNIRRANIRNMAADSRRKD